MKRPPKAGAPHTIKFVDGETYYWCAEHKEWCKHKTEDCRVRKKRLEKEAAQRQSAATTAIQQTLILEQED